LKITVELEDGGVFLASAEIVEVDRKALIFTLSAEKNFKLVIGNEGTINLADLIQPVKKPLF